MDWKTEIILFALYAMVGVYSIYAARRLCSGWQLAAVFFLWPILFVVGLVGILVLDAIKLKDKTYGFWEKRRENRQNPHENDEISCNSAQKMR